MALNVGLASDRICEWKRNRENGGEVNNTKVYIANYETFRWIFNGCYARISIWLKYKAIINDLGEKKLVFFETATETKMKQLENSKETH
jgi:hypothetical protein